MIERQAGRLVVKVPLVMANARGLLEAGRSALQAGEDVFDFAEVREADSSALAVMLGWLRAAELSRSTVRFANIPAGVRSLAELYGVAELLPLA
ncbi:STAS domain-containing protein [Dechloromonas sp. TW-R-39-2]|uniref:STAS domain-containing protein n=1 Tax=Dechloromonas TaxID=73029 RepID=UPI00193D1316|nr:MULTISPECIES: STAS domain-containing protein [Dechloromonas]QRM20601.1 STAS domain-containing protein [Dechloromonas sp. TW-R-39-2]UCV11030.1 STAS domain-containing protein [Dechloromonas denitrificans]